MTGLTLAVAFSALFDAAAVAAPPTHVECASAYGAFAKVKETHTALTVATRQTNFEVIDFSARKETAVAGLDAAQQGLVKDADLFHLMAESAANEAAKKPLGKGASLANSAVLTARACDQKYGFTPVLAEKPATPPAELLRCSVVYRVLAGKLPAGAAKDTATEHASEAARRHEAATPEITSEMRVREAQGTKPLFDKLGKASLKSVAASATECDTVLEFR